MSSEVINEFHAAVWVSAAKHGMKPSHVAADIMEELYPQTLSAAGDEGALAYLRDGINKAVKQVFSAKPKDENQDSLFDIDASLMPHVENLKRFSFYVEAIDEFLTVTDLIKNVRWLDDARKHLRRKGEETLAEASRLDKLYAAVIARSAANDNCDQKVAA